MFDFISYIPLWNYNILGNTAGNYAAAFGVFMALLIVFYFIQKTVLWRFRKFAEATSTNIDDTLINIVESIKPPFYAFLALYFAANVLALPPLASSILLGVLIITLVYQVIIAFQILIDYIFGHVLSSKLRDDGGTKAALDTLQSIMKWSLWGIGILLVVQNFGANITSLIAGLGIGGLALAFAAQNILADLFSSFTILFDKPFRPGDFIVAGEHAGTVEKIGIKTTHIRASQGELIIISNRELTSTRVQNFQQLKERRLLFEVGVLYETPQDKLESIPKIIQDVVERTEMTRFDRSHFVRFDESALTFQTAFFVLSPDYKEFLDGSQKVLFGVNKAFAENGISMAYPTQTVHLKKS